MHGLPPPSSVLTEQVGDPLLRMRAYRVAAELMSSAWTDAEALNRHSVTHRVAGQLYTAVISICANLGEGYSRSSGADRVRLFEYALGSCRESTVWYQAAVPILGIETVEERLETLTEIRRLLLSIIPRERRRTIRANGR